MEDWIFGDQTLSALLTYQAMSGLEETGVVDEATWASLIGPELCPIEPQADESGFEPERPSAILPTSPAGSQEWTILFAEEDEAMPQHDSLQQNGSQRDSAQNPKSPAEAAPSVERPPVAAPTSWPMLCMDDGDRNVHYLQCALEREGFYCGEDDMRWWQFGSSTESALRTFQAVSNLPETGVTDSRTWLALMGDTAVPADLLELHSADPEFDDDMAGHDGAVWLLGEHRWARKM